MIRALNVTKKFDNNVAVDNISLDIKKANVFGLIGTNGAGKSTFLRMLTGIIKPDCGDIFLDDEPILENEKAKQKFFYISDEQYFFKNATPKDMKNFYITIYQNFDNEKYSKLMKSFGLDENKRIKTFSKGMKKQLSIIFSLASNTEYVIFDETFDGLDPVVRQVVKSLLAKEIEERDLTPIIASHNLRELEDTCDNIGLLHKGGVILSKDLEEVKLGIHKIQIVFNDIPETLYNHLDIIKEEKRGALSTLVIRGEEEKIKSYIESINPTFYESLPLTLEEIFIVETEVVGYDVKSLIF